MDGHHLIYRTPIESGALSDLMLLCRRCHDLVHSRMKPYTPEMTMRERRCYTTAFLRANLPKRPKGIQKLRFASATSLELKRIKRRDWARLRETRSF